MANPFAKSRPVNQPYAIYRAGDMIWHVLKTYKQVKNEDTYARWMVAAKQRRDVRIVRHGRHLRS
jgi:hypothetical protein